MVVACALGTPPSEILAFRLAAARPDDPEARATLAGVPAERIAENLAFINWTVLTALALGSFGAVVAGRLGTAATRGYLGFTALCAVAFGPLAVPSDGALPVVSA